jgi:hypothetical protein
MGIAPLNPSYALNEFSPKAGVIVLPVTEAPLNRFSLRSITQSSDHS